MPNGGKGGQHQRYRAAAGRIGDRKGTAGARAARSVAAPEPRSSSRSTARRSQRTCSRASCSATRKGAFTGAAKQTPGKFELANKGTLFLDEIGDLPISLQAKLLRFLQERVVERIGGREEIPVDVRIVCATHQDLKDHIATGKFREDLFYRLAEIVLRIPPLRERKGDASLLAHAFLRRFSEEHRRGSLTLLPEAVDAIEAYAWPGNVRELENCVKRAVIMADSSTLRAQDFGLEPVLRSRNCSVFDASAIRRSEMR